MCWIWNYDEYFWQLESLDILDAMKLHYSFKFYKHRTSQKFTLKERFEFLLFSLLTSLLDLERI